MKSDNIVKPNDMTIDNIMNRNSTNSADIVKYNNKQHSKTLYIYIKHNSMKSDNIAQHDMTSYLHSQNKNLYKEILVIYVCVYIYIYMNLFMRSHFHVVQEKCFSHVPVHTYIYTYTYVHTYIHTHVHAYTHTCIYIYIYIYIHTYIHT